MKKSLGLGRGLDALIDTTHVSTAGSSSISEIPLAHIYANPDQPRHDFDPDALEELAQSIKEHGVISPITLRKDSNNSYMIIAGERRYRASKMAGLVEIPALVKTIDDNNAMEIALIENVQRENLNPIEEANAYKNLMECCDYELPDVARLIGKSSSYIRNMLRLTSLPDSVQNLVGQGELSASHARTIAVAENPEELAHNIIANKLSVSESFLLNISYTA